MRVAVAVLTYKRELELEKCLRSITAAINHPSVANEWIVDIIVGDNDPSSNQTESYVPNCRRLKTEHSSVAAGRQFLLQLTRDEKYDYLVFVDDDEVVSEPWLGSMLRTAVAHDCAAVAGPVLPLDLPLQEVPLHTRRRRKTGASVPSAGAGNLLLDLGQVRETNFDLKWPLPGGEDTDFTRRLTKQEGSIVWCDGAEVFEPVTTDRRSKRWLIRRYFLNGRILRRTTGPAPVLSRARVSILRGIAIAVSTLRMLVLPSSSTGFRFFLDHGVRNAGYLYESLRCRK